MDRCILDASCRPHTATKLAICGNTRRMKNKSRPVVCATVANGHSPTTKTSALRSGPRRTSRTVSKTSGGGQSGWAHVAFAGRRNSRSICASIRDQGRTRPSSESWPCVCSGFIDMLFRVRSNLVRNRACCGRRWDAPLRHDSSRPSYLTAFRAFNYPPYLECNLQVGHSKA